MCFYSFETYLYYCVPLLLLVILEGRPNSSKPIKEKLDKQTDNRDDDRETGRQIKCELGIKLCLHTNISLSTTSNLMGH